MVVSRQNLWIISKFWKQWNEKRAINDFGDEPCWCLIEAYGDFSYGVVNGISGDCTSCCDTVTWEQENHCVSACKFSPWMKTQTK